MWRRWSPARDGFRRHGRERVPPRLPNQVLSLLPARNPGKPGTDGPALFGHTRTRVGHFYHRDAAFTSAGYTNLIPGGIARTARLECLYRITRQIDENAKQLIVIGLNGQAALHGDNPPDRDVEAEAKRLVHLFDQRLNFNRLALGRQPPARHRTRASTGRRRSRARARASVSGRSAAPWVGRGRELI